MPDRVTLVALIDHLGRGGSERQLFLSMIHLDQQKFDRHIVVFHPSRHAVYDKELTDSGIKIWTLPTSYRSIQQRLRFLTVLLRKLDADIVHSWTVHDNPYAGLAGRLASVPVRWGSVRSSLKLAGFQALPSYYRYASLHLVSRLVINASSLQSELLHEGVKQEQILLLPNMVALDPTPESEVDLSEYGINRGHRVIGTVGNLRNVKNQQLFIEAIAEVIAVHPDVRGVIVGQQIPDEIQLPIQLQGRIEELGMTERIVLAGFRSDIAGLLRRFDVFCLTSRSEGTPNSLLEAMAAGCPVVATAVGGIPDVVRHESNGIVVPSENREALTKAVFKLLDEPDWAHRLGEEAQRFIDEQHGCLPIARRLSHYYLEALPG